MTRISVLCFVCYLLPSSRSITWIVRFLFAFYISIFIFPIFLDFLKCKPYAASWDVSVQASGAKCLNYITVGLAVSVIYVVADAILVMIPMVVVWNLRIQKRRKVGALSLLAIGMLSCAFCIWKTAYLQSIYATPDVTCKQALCTLSLQLSTSIPFDGNALTSYRGTYSRSHPE